MWSYIIANHMDSKEITIYAIDTTEQLADYLTNPKYWIIFEKSYWDGLKIEPMIHTVPRGSVILSGIQELMAILTLHQFD